MAKSVDSMIGDLVGTLTDPIIVYPGGWGDSLPEWLKNAITLERLTENMKETKGEQPTGTDAEACAYLNTASLTAPMDGDWSQIYLYVAGGEMKSQAKSELPEDIKVEALTESQWRDLKELKNWIYRQRVKHRKEKAHGERRKTEEEAKTRELETRPVQPSFF